MNPRNNVKKAYARWIASTEWRGKTATAKSVLLHMEISALRTLVDELEILAQTLYKQAQEVEQNGHN